MYIVLYIILYISYELKTCNKLLYYDNVKLRATSQLNCKIFTGGYDIHIVILLQIKIFYFYFLLLYQAYHISSSNIRFITINSFLLIL